MARSCCWLRSVGALGLVVSAGNAVAQAPQGGGAEDPGAAAVAVARPGEVALPTITTYATRSPIPVEDYPGQVTVIERDRIESLQPSSVFDVFEGVPGVQVQGGPRRSGQTVSIRGLAGEGVLVLFDGARQSFVSGHDGRAFIDPSLLQAVEVIRGPGSALYGSGALGGVIAFRTVDAADFLEGDETVGGQLSFGFQDVNDEFATTGTVFGRTQDGRFDGVASLTYRGSEDIELGSGLALPSEDDILSGLVKGSFNVTDDLTVSVGYIAYRLDGSDPNNPQGNNLADPGNRLVDRESENDTVQARITYAPSDNPWIDLALVPFYTRTGVEEPEPEVDRFLVREVDTLGVFIDNRSRFTLSDTVEMTVTVGGEYYRDEQEGEDSNTDTGARGGVPNARTRVFAAFVQNDVRIDDLGPIPGTLTVIPALRYDSYSSEADGQPDVDDDALSPRVGVSYEPVPGLSLFGNYAEGFRAPSFDELFAAGTHFSIPDLTAPPGLPVFFNNQFIGDPGLEPERSETFEVGLGLNFDNLIFDRDRFSARGSYYWSDVDNLIDLDVNIPATCIRPPFTPCGSGAAFGNTSTYRNVTNAELEGFELSVEYDSPRAFATATFATIDGEDADTGEPVGVLFPNRFYTDFGVKIPEFDARLGSRVTVAADFTDVDAPEEERDGYTSFDLYAAWEPFDGPLAGLRVDVGIDNVTNKDFNLVGPGVSEPGRNVRGAIRYRIAF